MLPSSGQRAVCEHDESRCWIRGRQRPWQADGAAFFLGRRRQRRRCAVQRGGAAFDRRRRLQQCAQQSLILSPAAWRAHRILSTPSFRAKTHHPAGKDAKATAAKAAAAVKKNAWAKQHKLRTNVVFHRPKTLKRARDPKYTRKAAAGLQKLDHYAVLKCPLTTESAMKKIEDNNTLVSPFGRESRARGAAARHAVLSRQRDWRTAAGGAAWPRRAGCAARRGARSRRLRAQARRSRSRPTMPLCHAMHCLTL